MIIYQSLRLSQTFRQRHRQVVSEAGGLCRPPGTVKLACPWSNGLKGTYTRGGGT